MRQSYVPYSRHLQLVMINRSILMKNNGYSMIFGEKSYYIRINGEQKRCQPFLIKVILLLASRLLLSTTFM